MQDYLSKWTFTRFLQLLVGGFFLQTYFHDHSIMPLAFGGMMAFQALANVGCFSSKGCSTPRIQQDDSIHLDEVEVEYEEVG